MINRRTWIAAEERPRYRDGFQRRLDVLRAKPVRTQADAYEIEMLVADLEALDVMDVRDREDARKRGLRESLR